MKFIFRFTLMLTAAVALNALAPSQARAETIDCRVSCGQFGFGGAYWSTTAVQAPGNGAAADYNAFYALLHDGRESGSNTGGSAALAPDVLNPEALRLSQVPVVNIGGNLYYEFLIDQVDENGNPKDVALNNVQICLAATGSLAASASGCPATSIFKYGFGTFQAGSTLAVDNYVKLQDSVDAFMYIPTSYLGTDGSQFVYLFSQFGAVDKMDSSHQQEEWAVRMCGHTYGGTVLNCFSPSGVPEPGTLVLFGTGLIAVAAGVRRSRARV